MAARFVAVGCCSVGVVVVVVGSGCVSNDRTDEGKKDAVVGRSLGTPAVRLQSPLTSTAPRNVTQSVSRTDDALEDERLSVRPAACSDPKD